MPYLASDACEYLPVSSNDGLSQVLRAYEVAVQSHMSRRDEFRLRSRLRNCSHRLLHNYKGAKTSDPAR